jgi:hypothetical protein
MRYAALVETIVLLLAASGVAWGQDATQRDTSPLPPPPPDSAVYSGRAIEHPFERIDDQAGSMRVMFEGPGPEKSQIEIREILISPKALVRIPALLGPALVDLRSGAGTLRVGDHAASLDITNPTSIAPGEPLEIQNTVDNPLLMRLYVVEAR